MDKSKPRNSSHHDDPHEPRDHIHRTCKSDAQIQPIWGSVRPKYCSATSTVKIQTKRNLKKLEITTNRGKNQRNDDTTIASTPLLQCMHYLRTKTREEDYMKTKFRVLTRNRNVHRLNRFRMSTFSKPISVRASSQAQFCLFNRRIQEDSKTSDRHENCHTGFDSPPATKQPKKKTSKLATRQTQMDANEFFSIYFWILFTFDVNLCTSF